MKNFYSEKIKGQREEGRRGNKEGERKEESEHKFNVKKQEFWDNILQLETS